MEGKICQVHEGEVVSVCFFEGCTQHFLCGECFGFHPDNHKSKIKSMMSLVMKDDWVKSNEELRDSQIVHLKSYYQTKDCLLDENQKKLKGMVEEIIKCLRKRLSQWVEELKISLDFTKSQETKETFAKLEGSLTSLKNIDFREGDIYNKVDKVKLFNESILPESREVCKQVQTVVDGIEIDQSKLDVYKEDIVELSENIPLKDLFALPKSKRQKVSEQLNLLKQKVESLTVTNEELKEEVSMFKAELDAVVALKLKLHKDYEALDVAHKKLLEKYAKFELLSEDSQIIQNKDVKNIISWIENPVNSEKPGTLKLDLLYRATRDGFLSSKFQMKCEKKSPTITFIKSKEYGRVFGGYTMKKWENNDNYIEDKEAFLFSLTHGEKYPIEESQAQYAIYNGNSIFNATHILAFGRGQDICISEGCSALSNKAYTNFPTSYKCDKFADPDAPGAKEYLAGSWKFTIEEIEVYQVVWSE